jgi:hypothetical protein
VGKPIGQDERVALCHACQSEPSRSVGTVVRLGSTCVAVLRVARAHGIDGAAVLSNKREMWLPITGFETRYDVSSRGRVRSRKTGRILKTPATGPFYPMVELDGRTYRVHIVMALAFLGPRQPGMYALHWNDRKTDLRISNIRWGTARQNYWDSVRNGHRRSSKVAPGHRQADAMTHQRNGDKRIDAPSVRGHRPRGSSVVQGTPMTAVPSSPEQNAAYVAELCVDCRTRNHLAGRPRCEQCRTVLGRDSRHAD